MKEQDSSPKLTMNQYKVQMDDEKKLKGGSGLVLKLRGADDRPTGGQYYDVSLESQLVTVLEAASTNGATQKVRFIFIMYSMVLYVCYFSDCSSPSKFFVAFYRKLCIL